MSDVIDVRSYLSGKGLHLKDAGPDNVHMQCVFCNEDPSKRGRLYVNVSASDLAGLYQCHRCGEKGNIKLLRKFFGDPPLDGAEDVAGPRLAVLNSAAQFYVSHLDGATVEYLKTERGLTLDTIERHQIGRAPGGTALGVWLVKEQGFDLADVVATGLIRKRSDGRHEDFLSRQITIPYHVNGQVIQIRGKEVGGKYFTPPGQKARLYNVDVAWDADTVCITEGEFDCLILEQQGYVAVGAPGAISWQDSWNGYFDEVRRIFCVFDNDEAGDRGAQKLKDIFGAKVKRIELPKTDDGKKQDVTDWFVNADATPEDFEELIRSSVVRDSILITPQQALDEWTGVQGVQGLQLGWETLDQALYPGLLPAQVMVVLAKTNTGKTITLLNLFQLVTMKQPDAKILFLSLEQTRGEWFERARRIWNLYNLECPAPDVNAETVRYWQPRLRMIDKNRISEAELVNALEEYRMEMGCLPDLVAVDYLGYWAAGFKGKDRYEKVSDAVMSLKAVAKEWRTPIITPHQVSRGAEFGKAVSLNHARDSGAIEETADHVLGIWALDDQDPRDDDRKGSTDPTGFIDGTLSKSRHGGKGKKILLSFGKLTLGMVDRTIDTTRGGWFAKEAVWHKDASVSWQAAIEHYRTGIPIRLAPGSSQP